jgi:hypothetical protein
VGLSAYPVRRSRGGVIQRFVVSYDTEVRKHRGDSLVSRKQMRVIELLVERVAYGGDGGNISISFRPSRIKALAGELAERKEEAP